MIFFNDFHFEVASEWIRQELVFFLYQYDFIIVIRYIYGETIRKPMNLLKSRIT